MAVTRESLRKRSQAEQDFYSPMTGGTQIRYADAPTPRRDTYGSRVKDRLADIGTGTRRAAPIIEAIKVAVQKTEDPFTQIKEQKSYAPEEENDIMGALEGAAGAAQDAIGEGVAQAESAVESYRKSSNQKAAERRALRQQERQDDLKAAREERKAAADERAALRGDMKKLFERDRRMYGNTVPKGSMGSGSKPGPAVDTRPRHSVGRPEDQPKVSKFEKKETRTFRGQGSSVNKLGKTAPRQGGTVKDGKKVAKDTSPAVSLSNYRDNREKQRNIRAQGRLSDAVKKTGIPTRPKAGSFGISQAGKDRAAINKGIAAAKKTGIPTKPPAGSFGISAAGRAQAEANKAEARRKAAAKAKAAKAKAQKVKSERARASAAAAKAKAEGKTKAQQAAAARKAAGPNRTMSAGQQTRAQAGPSARTAAGNRARVKANARKRAQAAAKKRVARKKAMNKRRSRGASRRRGRRRSRCDIRCKVNISLLMDMNLLRDDLADVAYFVRELREVES